MQDALNYAAGVRPDAYGLDGRNDGVRIRGGTPDVYLDGLRQAYGYYTSTARTDPYTLERAEVLRGPSGMLFGAGTVAGVVNMVSKRPQVETQREVGVQVGSWNRKQIQTDLTGPLNEEGTLSYRLIALKRDADTQVDHVPDNRSLIAPSLSWRPSGATTLTLQALWQKDESGSTSQFFPWAGTIEPTSQGRLPSNRFIGEPSDGYDTERKTFGWLFEHQINDAFAVRQNFRYADNESDSHYHYANFWTTWTPPTIGRTYYKAITETRITTLDNHAELKISTGDVRHIILAGADYSRQIEDVLSGSDSSTTIDAYNPVYGVDVANPTLTASPTTDQRQFGVYVQDQLKYGSWIVLAGLRHDRAISGKEGSDDEKTNATTHRLGAMYQVGNGWAPYVSYSESFTPVAGVDANGNRYKPLRGEQIEVGVKFQPERGATNFTLSAYDLKERNQSITDPANPNFQIQVGETNTRGVELETKTTLNRVLDLIASYNYTDADKQIEGLPQHMASTWMLYRYAIGEIAGFSTGAGVRYLSSFRDRSGGGRGPEIPAVTLLDLMFAYDQKNWRYALNINNATDKEYFSTCLARGDCWWGARRNIVASATYRF